MKKTLIALAIVPALALAQPAGPAQGGRPGPGPGAGPGPGQGRGMMMNGKGRGDPEKMEKRMRFARTLGLAEALDLDSAQALKLGDAVAKFDERRLAAHRQLRDARQTLRRAATGEKVAPAEVDQAIQKALEARAQIQAVDREVLNVVTKDLTPEKKARAVLFLERFQNRFGPGPGMGRGMHGGRGRGGGMGMGMGPGGGMGMGPGATAGSCPNPDCPWNDGDDDE